MSNYNSTYNQTQDHLDDNVDVAAYGVVMVGILLVVLSFSRNKEKKGGLLYQKQNLQHISPAQLEKSITKNRKAPSISISPPVIGPSPTTTSTPSSPGLGEGFELPDIDDPPIQQGMQGPGQLLIQDPSINDPGAPVMSIGGQTPHTDPQFGPQSAVLQSTVSQSQVPGSPQPQSTVSQPPLQQSPNHQSNGAQFQQNGQPYLPQTPPVQNNAVDSPHPSTVNDTEHTLSCPNCEMCFSLKGIIKEVICPRCGKRFDSQ
jgi:hypothetical protein